MRRDWQNKPWYPGRATAAVLYGRSEGWRFALTTEKRGIVDGRLNRPDLDDDGAKAEILQRLRATDEVEPKSGWTTQRDGWWSADLRPIELNEAPPS